MTILAHMLAQAARELAKDGALSDPTDDTIVLAVQDIVMPDTEGYLAPELRKLVVREYNAHAA